MANYTTLKYGSKGDEVKKLQQGLINAGYDLGSSGADGVYGGRTQAAVRQYQQANGLSVDGVAGQQTLGKLYTPSTTTTTGDGTTPAQTEPKTPKEWADYYEDKSNEFKPPEITEREDYSSPYASDIESALDAWKNRKDFSYDFNTDPMYQQYREQYILGGQQAMRDTMGQAAAMTGGYGSSYGQMVGQQAYDNYLSQLNNVIPELRSQAYQMYQDEGDRLMEALTTYLTLDDTAYGRYRDDVSDSRLDDETNYQRYLDALSYWQGQRDYYTSLSGDDGYGGAGGGSDPTTEPTDYEDEEPSAMFADLNLQLDQETRVGIPNYRVDELVYNALRAGKITDDEAALLRQRYLNRNTSDLVGTRYYVTSGTPTDPTLTITNKLGKPVIRNPKQQTK